MVVSLPVEMFSEYIDANTNFLACLVTKLPSVTANECYQNNILKTSHLNLETPNLDIMWIPIFIEIYRHSIVRFKYSETNHNFIPFKRLKIRDYLITFLSVANFWR